MTRCTSCAGPLDTVAVLCSESVCTGCEVRAIETAQRLKARGQAQALAAHPGDGGRVMAAIKQLAASGREFSSNDARSIHGVTGPVVGAAFTAARKAGLIEAVGFTTSTDPGTHAHPVRTWRGAA